jgi:hypothetical protein
MIRNAEDKRHEVLHLNLTDGPTLKLNDDPVLRSSGRSFGGRASMNSRSSGTS